MILVGIGKDGHMFSVNNENSSPLTLGGVGIDDSLFIHAKSDGDVVIHSICNAISTALGGGSLSTYADVLCEKGIRDSKKYVEAVLDFMKKNKYSIHNVSCMIEAGKPKLEQFRTKITLSLAEMLAVDKSQIGIACTTLNGLTFAGRGEGIVCTSIVSLKKNQ